jgi:hypothetical protein
LRSSARAPDGSRRAGPKTRPPRRRRRGAVGGLRVSTCRVSWR